MNLPNILTVSRIVLIPIFVVIYYLPVSWAHVGSAIVFALAAGTDYLDGYLARKWNQTTPFGAFLDPVADKLMVAISLTMIIENFQLIWITVPAMIIIGREIVVSALREWMAQKGKHSDVKVAFIGKVKTACQMWAILLLLVAVKGEDLFDVGTILMYVAAVLTIWSMIKYLMASWDYLFAIED